MKKIILLFAICVMSISMFAQSNQNMERAIEAYQNQDYQNAINYFEKILNEDAKNLEVINKLSACYFKIKNIDKASEYAQKSIKINKEQIDPYWYTAYDYLTKGDFKNCLKELIPFMGNIEKTGKTDKLNYAVKFFDAIYQENLIFFFEEIEKLFEKNPNMWSIPYTIGKMMIPYYEETAYFYFERAYHINPTIKELNYNMAYCLNKTHKFSQALEFIDKTIEITGRPTVYEFYLLNIEKADILSNMKEYDKAINLCDSIYMTINAEMIKNFLGGYTPEKEDYLAELFNYMEYIKYYESYFLEYKRDYQKSLECSKDAKDNFRYGRMLYKLGRKEEAKDTLSKVIETLNPYQNSIKIAYCKIFMEDFDGAEDFIKNQILSNENLNPGNYYDISCMYSLMNNKEKAIEYLKISLEMGYNEIHHIERDPDMDNIRDTKEYQEIIKEYKKE